MVARHPHSINAAEISFPPASRAIDTAALTDEARMSAEASQASSGRKLRNRLILANAIAWVVIIVAVRLIFF